MRSPLSLRQVLLVSGAFVAVAGYRAVGGSAEAPAPPKAVFDQYCIQCHGSAKPMAGISLSKMEASPVGDGFQSWQKVASVLEQNRMPPKACRSRARSSVGTPCYG